MNKNVKRHTAWCTGFLVFVATLLSLRVGGATCWAQEVEFIYFDGNSVAFGGIRPGEGIRIEWTPEIAATGSSKWSPLAEVVATGTTARIQIPSSALTSAFFRVRTQGWTVSTKPLQIEFGRPVYFSPHYGGSGYPARASEWTAHITDMRILGVATNRLVVNDLAAVERLDVQGCQSLESLAVSGLWNLRHLRIRACPRLDTLTLRHLPALTKFECSGNAKLARLSSDGLTSLSESVLIGNPSLVTLPLRDWATLNVLHLQRVGSVTLDLPECGRLETLRLTQMQNLRFCRLGSRTQMEIALISECPMLEALTFDGATTRRLSLSRCDRLRVLAPGNMHTLDHLTVDECANLERVSMAGLSGLERFNMQSSRPVQLDFCGLRRLKELILAIPAGEEMAICSLPRLETLVIGDLKVGRLRLADLPSLKTILNCSRFGGWVGPSSAPNDVRELDITGMTNAGQVVMTPPNEYIDTLAAQEASVDIRPWKLVWTNAATGTKANRWVPNRGCGPLGTGSPVLR